MLSADVSLSRGPLSHQVSNRRGIPHTESRTQKRKREPFTAPLSLLAEPELLGAPSDRTGLPDRIFRTFSIYWIESFKKKFRDEYKCWCFDFVKSIQIYGHPDQFVPSHFRFLAFTHAFLGRLRRTTIVKGTQIRVEERQWESFGRGYSGAYTRWCLNCFLQLSTTVERRTRIWRKLSLNGNGYELSEP